jgi:O-antigen ligase
MNQDKFDFIANVSIVVGFSIYVVGAVLSIALMNLGLGVAGLAWLSKKIKNCDFKLPSTPYNKYILFFLVALGLSFIDSLNVANSLDDFKRLWVPILLFYIVVDTEPSLKVIKNWFIVLFLTMSGSIIYSFWQYQQGINRVHGNIFVMEFASLLVFMAIYTFVYALLGKIRLRYKLLLAVTSISAMISLIFTQTRGAWLALLSSLAIVLLLEDKKYLVWFLVIVVLFITIVPSILPQQHIDRFISIFDVEDNNSNVTRITLWQGSLLIYQDHWVNGVGLNNFSDVIRRPDYLLREIVSDTHAHNVLLQLAAETGTLGVISFIVLFGVIIWSLYSYYQAAEENHLKLFFLGTLGVIVAYLSHGLTEYNLYDMYVSRLVWFILAISLVLKTKFGLIMESD